MKMKDRHAYRSFLEAMINRFEKASSDGLPADDEPLYLVRYGRDSSLALTTKRFVKHPVSLSLILKGEEGGKAAIAHLEEFDKRQALLSLLGEISSLRDEVLSEQVADPVKGGEPKGESVR
ncbi:hypothetical protein ACFQY0_20375 [Haloferula chungangensis]|uniref:Uncharacterized protein n=1 Tax=Haloferula chungangensis TaxID=1048331 RepID=A0ABW2LDY2_9BACT